jgi:orotate phosphoribosyltransferase
LNFRSVAQLSDQLLHWSRTLPADIDVIVGIPRSGLLAANMLSLYMNVRLTDVDGLLGGRCFPWGIRRKKPGDDGAADMGSFLDRPRKVLVLDDSLWSGRSMKEARARIAEAGLSHEILYGAVYVAPGRVADVDLCCEVLNGPRVFEWNVLHGKPLEGFCVGLEGVLWRGPARTVEQAAALPPSWDLRPHLVPTGEVGWLVTALPESHRADVEAWLQRHGIRYRNLVMADVAPDALHGAGARAAWKAHVYRSTDAALYIEDSFWEAVTIARLSGRHVLCTRSMQLVQPGTVPLPRVEPPAELHPVLPRTLGQVVTDAARHAARAMLPVSAQRAIRQWRGNGVVRPADADPPPPATAPPAMASAPLPPRRIHSGPV